MELRPGAYADSVTLLQVSRAVQGLDGVLAAQVAMATALNIEVLTEMGFEVPTEATTNDMVVALRLADADALTAALAGVDQALRDANRRPEGSTEIAPPRITGSALRRSAGTLGPTRSWWSPCPARARSSRRWTRSTPAATSWSSATTCRSSRRSRSSARPPSAACW